MAMVYSYMKDRLHGEYLKAADKVELYADLHGISENVQSEKLMDLLDLLLAAQEEGKPCEEIVGTDMEQFSKNYFADYGKKERLADFFDSIKRIAKIVLFWEILWILLSLGEKDFNLLTLTTDVSGYLLGFICAGLLGVMVSALAKLLYRSRNYSVNLHSVIVMTAFICSVIGSVILWGGKEIKLPSLPIVSVCVLYLLLYYGFVWGKRYHETGSIKREKSPYTTSFFKVLKEEVKKENPTDFSRGMVKGLAKRYTRLNKKREKKGKEVMDTEMFFEHLEKESRKADKAVPYIIIGIVLFFSILVIMDSKPLDCILWFVMIAALEYGIYRLFEGASHSAVKERALVWEECRRRGMGLLELNDWYQGEKEKGNPEQNGIQEREGID